jgi:hypothetical protein
MQRLRKESCIENCNLILKHGIVDKFAILANAELNFRENDVKNPQKITKI